MRRTLDIEDKELHFKAQSSESRSPWSAYIKFSESAALFILFQQGNWIFVPIAKRKLYASQIDEFRAHFQTHLSPK